MSSIFLDDFSLFCRYKIYKGTKRFNRRELIRNERVYLYVITCLREQSIKLYTCTDDNNYDSYNDWYDDDDDNDGNNNNNYKNNFRVITGRCSANYY